MTRKVTKLIETRPVTSWETQYTCTKCGRGINPGWDEPEFANELIILLNQDECVSHRFRKDYCTNCLTPLWDDLCHLLGLDPTDTSGEDFHDQVL